MGSSPFHSSAREADGAVVGVDAGETLAAFGMSNGKPVNAAASAFVETGANIDFWIDAAWTWHLTKGEI